VRRAAPALIAGGVLLCLYVLTLAPGVTFWDAGEFIAAARSFGVPHPPGTPLFVVLLRAWSLALHGVGTALATNLFSAVATAAAAALSAGLVARWTGSAASGIAAGLCAGCMATVWANATETEVYAASLLLAAAMLAVADRAAMEDGSGRWDRLLAYLFALAVPLHLSALVAGPGALALVWRPGAGERAARRIVALGGALVLAGGVGTVRPTVTVVGLLLLVVATVGAPRGTRWRALSLLVPVAIAASALFIMMVRARFDPTIDQGYPSTVSALLDVVARRQYAVAPLWPRQAPLWIQAGNLLEYADWQVALGGHGAPGVDPVRTAWSLAFGALGLLGCLAHRRLDRRTWRALVVLMGGASLGVVLYLNLKAGPSFGAGVLPTDASHEARERDYFFVLAFWTWGLWSGVGAVRLVRGVAARVTSVRLPARLTAGAGCAVAMLPAALNWHAVDRGAEPAASLPRLVAETILRSVPPRGVVFVDGDNDTYPLWYLQTVEGVRGDVTPVTVPLLGADWYRAELARRYGLLPPDAVRDWYGEGTTVRMIAETAARLGRPVAVSVTVGSPDAIGFDSTDAGRAWREWGMVFVRDSGTVGVPPVLAAPASWSGAEVRASADPTEAIMLDDMRCRVRPPAGVPIRGVLAYLDSLCNPK
jgi:Protein O-mannosyl-transferase TMEM260-like